MADDDDELEVVASQVDEGLLMQNVGNREQALRGINFGAT